MSREIPRLPEFKVKTGRKILRMPGVKGKTGLGRSTIYELMANQKFPRPVDLGGGRAVGWFEDAIDDWLATLTTK